MKHLYPVRYKDWEDLIFPNLKLFPQHAPCDARPERPLREKTPLMYGVSMLKRFENPTVPCRRSLLILSSNRIKKPIANVMTPSSTALGG